MRARAGVLIVAGMSDDPAAARLFPAVPGLAEPDLAGLRRARAQHLVFQRLLRGLGPVLILAVVITAALRHPGPGTSGRGLVVSAAMAAAAASLAGGIWSAVRHSGRTVAVFGAIMAVSSCALMWAQPAGPGAAAALAGVLLAGRALPVRRAVALSGTALVVLAVSAEVIGRGHGPDPYLLIALAALAGLFYLAGQLRQANDQAERLLIELEAGRAAEARAAGLAERQRLAREMHDVLAHSLSGLLLKLEGARMLAARDQADPRLPAAIDDAHRLARSGLEEARRAIGALRGEQMPGPDRLPELAARFGRDQGIPCRLTVSGAERPLDAEARLAVYRVAQEALTNIAKHAQAGRVELCLAYEPAATRLTVEDLTAATPAGGTAKPPPGNGSGNGGYGLAGMRERAELIGGTLRAGTTPTGFRVELEVPS